MKPLAAPGREPESSRQTAARSRPREQGYIMLTLLLVVALMTIMFAAVIIPIKFEMQRDQETEMIHRGVQYTRAIRGYYQKFGRYPTKLEDLDDTNNLRYLRKHYKDPLNKNKDFKLLHFGDPGLSLTGQIGTGTVAGATPAGSLNGANGFGASGSTLGGSTLGGSSLGGSTPGGSTLGGSGFGSSPSSGSSGVNSRGVFAQASGQGSNASGSDSTQDASKGQEDESSGSQQIVSGGPIVGVASFCKNPTIREFNKKKKYNEWQFIYDPAADRGGLITTPYQPSLAGFGTQPALNGAQPAGTNSSSFGNSNGGSFGNSNGSAFGQSSTFGNTANPGGTAPPVQPPTPPQQ
jgi:type II secretory pathway pseudopilin PulG